MIGSGENKPLIEEDSIDFASIFAPAPCWRGRGLHRWTPSAATEHRRAWSPKGGRGPLFREKSGSLLRPNHDSCHRSQTERKKKTRTRQIRSSGSGALLRASRQDTALSRLFSTLRPNLPSPSSFHCCLQARSVIS
jgi:hypothetical protein